MQTLLAVLKILVNQFCMVKKQTCMVAHLVIILKTPELTNFKMVTFTDVIYISVLKVPVKFLNSLFPFVKIFH